ncbi:DNA recombination and repair protein RecO [Acetivibrio straminisolvens JCM 21531]|uniref:DNA recombination and repair protein RecO n=2 Tax=Acetivibrio straminisolvens TaxID=253314 RepID=W4V3P6_9FIRM|nr:DNA recombination and repair protein RecO [Acetivibrio straminisolvens JCM 21531]
MCFSFLKCGFLCTKCGEKDKGALRISEGAAKALNYIVHSKMNALFSFEVSGNVLEELGRVSQRYMRDRLEKNYNKLDFIKTLTV